MALAAAALGPVRSVATIAAPWHFAGFPDDARERLGALWARRAPAVAGARRAADGGAAERLLVRSIPARTVAKFEAFAALEGAAARTFVHAGGLGQ